MHRVHSGGRFTAWLLSAIVCVVFQAPPPAAAQIRADPAALSTAPPELADRLRADPFAYFRFINRAWTARVCDAFADIKNPPIVRLHGDAHVEQFAFTKDAWGLTDFDDSARGPAFVDIARFLASLDLAARQRGWTRDRDALWDRFLEGYRRGLANPGYRPPEPGIVHELRMQSPLTRAAYLTWAETLMQPMAADASQSVIDGMASFDRFMRDERPKLAPGYFSVVRAGWLRIGVGSAAARKVLIRVQGPTSDPNDDVLLEAKEVSNLDGLGCLKDSNPEAIRVINGTQQLGRIKHDILAVGPTALVPAHVGRAERSHEWWITSWDPSYREVRVSDLRSVGDLADIAFDSGVQLGTGNLDSVRDQALSSVTRNEARLRKQTAALVEELLTGWREFGGR